MSTSAKTDDKTIAMKWEPSALAKFLDLNVFEARGFTHYSEISRTLSFFDRAQREAGIRGCTGEIGVANGALFVPLALCCLEDEIAVAIDVFDQSNLNWNPYGGSSSLSRFKKIIVDVIGCDDQVRYIEGDSFFLKPDAIRAAANGRGFRLFSIDGAHSVHHTVNDLDLAGAIINSGGIVLLDDIKNWGWPGVINGFARYMLLRDQQRLVPFFLYANKLLLTTPDHQEFFLEKTIELVHSYGRKPEVNGGYRISDFFGFRVLGWN